MQLKQFIPVLLASVASAQTLAEALASQNASLSSLTGLLSTQPALVSALGNAKNITILAPNNAALATFLNSTAGAAAATKPDLVTALLSYHVLNGTYKAASITTKPAFVPTLLTNTTYTNVTGGQVVEAVSTGSSVVFYSGLHLNSTVTQADVTFNGGVIHIIDTVLTIPESDSATAVAAGLTSLAGALTTANLVSTVDGLSDVTIFAPSNAAFQAIGSAVGSLSVAQLTSILEYHVVKGVVGYSSILTNTSLATVGGGNVTISIEDGSVFVNSAKVILPNVLVANGVVHVIDNVLNPNNTAATPIPTASTQSVAYSGASSVSSAASTSAPAMTTGSASPSGTASSTMSSLSMAAGAAMQTGAIGLGALLGGAAMVMGL